MSLKFSSMQCLETETLSMRFSGLVSISGNGNRLPRGRRVCQMATDYRPEADGSLGKSSGSEDSRDAKMDGSSHWNN